MKLRFNSIILRFKGFDGEKENGKNSETKMWKIMQYRINK